MTYHCQKLISHKFCASEKISNFHTVRKKEEWAKNEEETFYFFRKDSVGENDTSRVIDLFFQKSNVTKCNLCKKDFITFIRGNYQPKTFH